VEDETAVKVTPVTDVLCSSLKPSKVSTIVRKKLQKYFSCYFLTKLPKADLVKT
jgi:hypothetical protein